MAECKAPKRGPDLMSFSERKKFFDFYRTHPSRALGGFLKDIARSAANRKILVSYLRRRKRVTCLVMGCSHWKNPENATKFLQSFKEGLEVRMVVLDALPDALLEIQEHGVDCLPFVCPAQATPFLESQFDIVISDCLLTCCSFEQHEPVVREMRRVLKFGGLLLLGFVHSDEQMVFQMPERPITCYSWNFSFFSSILTLHGFSFRRGSTVETRLPGKWSKLKIANCVLLNDQL